MTAYRMHSSRGPTPPDVAAIHAVANGEISTAQAVPPFNERASTMHTQPRPDTASPRLLGATTLWLLAGGALLLTTALPPHTDLLGWTPAFWLLGAPLIMLLALQPGLPRQLLRLCRPHRRAVHAVVWHGSFVPR